MYKRTIWQDHVEGVQEGTDLNAANFNNIEAGVMEADALSALNAAYLRYGTDVAKNSEVVVVEATLTGSNASNSVDIPAAATRNNANYNLVSEIKSVNGGNAGDIIPLTKQANGFTVKYTGTASSVTVRFNISGGMI